MEKSTRGNVFCPTSKVHPAAKRAAIAAAAIAACIQASHAQMLEEVVVTSGKLEQQLFDAPASVSRVGGAEIRDSGPQVNLSDVLQRVPGVVALNRNNYAQDAQVSIRGFGARSAFGVRGLQILVDGIPQTTPDGQGQTNIATMSSVGSMEVMTGPLSQIYGNSSGGVIQVTTVAPPEGEHGQVQANLGSYGLARYNTQASFRNEKVSFLADLSALNIDGARANSAAKREQLNALLKYQLAEDASLQITSNVFLQPFAQDPLGLTAEEFEADPKQAGNKAISSGTRKITSQHQMGLRLNTSLPNGFDLDVKTYRGNRDNLQYLSSDKWVSIARDFDGLGIELRDKSGSATQWVVGFDKGTSKDNRTGGSASAGQPVADTLNRDEVNKAEGQGVFGQVEWLADSWGVTAGLRHSRVKISAIDNFLSNGDGGGSVSYTNTSPVFGVTHYAADNLNAYVNLGKGFETPTTAETAYTNTGSATPSGKFNPNLKASTSQQLEVGLKWEASAKSSHKAALFNIRSKDEIVVDISRFGNTAYRNAPGTTRRGLELSGGHALTENLTLNYSGTWMNATFDSAFAAGVEAGYQLPAVPKQQLWASLDWQQISGAASAQGFTPGARASLELVRRGGMWATDTHADGSYAAGFALLNLRTQYGMTVGKAKINLSAGINNLTNRKAVGSVIPNQSAGQYFEPTLPRNWTVGILASIPLGL